MLRIEQTFGARAGSVFHFDQPTITIGRDPGCDIAFNPHADLEASARHAEIIREANSYFLVDSGSRNGTFISGERVLRRTLMHGDEIEFGVGGPRLRVYLESAGSTEALSTAAPPLGGPIPTAPLAPAYAAPAYAAPGQNPHAGPTAGATAMPTTDAPPPGRDPSADARVQALTQELRALRWALVLAGGLLFLALGALFVLGAYTFFLRGVEP